MKEQGNHLSMYTSIQFASDCLHCSSEEKVPLNQGFKDLNTGILEDNDAGRDDILKQN